MKATIARLVVRVKIISYALLFSLQRLLVRTVRQIPGCWTVLGIPDRQIEDVQDWVSEKLREGKTYWPNGCAPHYASFGSQTPVLRRNKPPAGLEGVHPELRGQHLQVRSPFLASIPSARLLGSDGCVITPDGGLLTQSIWGRGLFQQDRIYRSLRLPAQRFLGGSYYTIASPFSSGYYHWVVEVLPRLFAYESVAHDRPPLIVNSPLSNWQLESLALLGFGEQELFALDSQHLQIQNLYFPSLVGINPYTLRWLKEALVKSNKVDPPLKRVYITRRRALRRRLLNEDEIEPILQQNGFMLVEMEGLSFAQQVSLLSQASIIVSIHGAGLTNMVFAPEGCKIMEIVDPAHVGAMYYLLAETLNHRYWSCAGESVGDESFRHGGAHGHGDITVPVASFNLTLAEMLQTEEHRTTT